MNSLRAVTRRAALAAFLLFAAGLFVVGPADASRTMDARSVPAPLSMQTLAPASSRELASLELPALGLPTLEQVEPLDASSRLGFAEDLSLLDVEACPCGFELFGGVGTKRCALTYARNNPVNVTDPDGRLAKKVIATVVKIVDGEVVHVAKIHTRKQWVRHILAHRDTQRAAGTSVETAAKALSAAGKGRLPGATVITEVSRLKGGEMGLQHLHLESPMKYSEFGKLGEKAAGLNKRWGPHVFIEGAALAGFMVDPWSEAEGAGTEDDEAIVEAFATSGDARFTTIDWKTDPRFNK